MASLMSYTKCGNWVHGRCAKIKRVTAKLAMHFVCSRCSGIMERTEKSMEKLFDESETVNEFSCLVDRQNSKSGFEAAVTARVRTGWERFRECGELLLRNRLPLRMTGRVYRCGNTV